MVSKKREIGYIIALVISLLTNVGLFIMPPAASEPITYYTNGEPLIASIEQNLEEQKTTEDLTPSPTPAAASASASASSVATAYKITANEPKINLNTATLDQLVRLPGIGVSTAQKILDYRTKKGSFKRIQDLMRINGIGEKKFADIKDFITVE